VSRSGLLFPILALKSPQINAVSWGWSVSSICSSSLVASVSCILLLCRDVVGGMYTLTIFILKLFGSIILVCRPYSLPVVDSIYSGFRTNVARPPRVLFGRRYSTSVNPSTIGGAVPSAIHVSCRQRISTGCYSSRRRSLR
jgi:hypothetical protein